MSRIELQRRRHHEVFDFSHWNLKFTVGVGRNEPPPEQNFAPVQEVFINCGKSGASMETMARDCAVLMSIALQYGAPIDIMRHAITRNVDGGPSGPIGALLDLLHKQEKE